MKLNITLTQNSNIKYHDQNFIDEWFLRRNISSGTQKSYKIAIKYFSNMIEKNISEIIEEAEIEEDAGLRPRKRKVSIYLLKYKNYLENSGITPSTVNLYFSAIKSFYKAFDITLPYIKLDSGDIGLEKNMGKPLTRKNIQQLINVATPREKALIYVMALSGMGQQEARDLTIRKFLITASSAIEKELDDVYDLFKFEDDILKEIMTVEITRKKNKYKHHTLIPPEASRATITYLKERCYGRNKKNQNKK